MKRLARIATMAFSATSWVFAQSPITDVGALSGAVEIVIDVRNPWTSTGMVVLTDSVYDVFAFGVATVIATQPFTWYGPDGNGSIAESDYALPGSPTYAVIGKIGGGGTPFHIGTHRRFKSLVSPPDTLYLGQNDLNGYFFDNAGYFVAHVTHLQWAPIVGVGGTRGSPKSYSLRQNFPNPFNPSTTIEFALERRENVAINIYNAMGQLVQTLLNEERQVGNHSVVWDGLDSSGQQAATGTYFYEIRIGNRVASKKMLLIK